MKNILFKIFGVIICIFALCIMVIGYETPYEPLFFILGTIALAVGCVLFIMSSDKTYNNSVSSARKIENTRNVKIEDIHTAFKNQSTILGDIWLGNIKLIKGFCLIIGPTENEDYLFLRKLGNSFYLGSNSNTSWITGPQNELNRLSKRSRKVDIFSDEDLVCYSLICQTAIDDIFAVIDEFVKTGNIKTFPNGTNLGKIYRFNEDFKLSGQKFYLTDYDGNLIYEIQSTYPLKNFSLKNVKTGQEIFRMTKKVLHFLDHYDFYYNGSMYGSFEQKANIMFDHFVMETTDGTFEMKNINDKIGANFIVKLNGEVIGTIAERFNLTAYNIVFDNFIMRVESEKHLPIVTAMAVMVAREVRRDRRKIHF